MTGIHIPAPEVWQRGPVTGVPPLLQPVAHALLQAREELNTLMEGADDALLWQRPAGIASPGFHLQHLSGVLDRVFTYARGESLTTAQLEQLNAEAEVCQPNTNTNKLVTRFNKQVEEALAQLKVTDEKTLPDYRGVGRKNASFNSYRVIGTCCRTYHAPSRTINGYNQNFKKFTRQIKQRFAMQIQ